MVVALTHKPLGLSGGVNSRYVIKNVSVPRCFGHAFLCGSRERPVTCGAELKLWDMLCFSREGEVTLRI